MTDVDAALERVEQDMPYNGDAAILAAEVRRLRESCEVHERAYLNVTAERTRLRMALENNWGDAYLIGLGELDVDKGLLSIIETAREALEKGGDE